MATSKASSTSSAAAPGCGGVNVWSYVAEAGPGDFIYVPPFVPIQEINASRDEPLSCVLVRSGQDPVVVNLDIAPAEPPEQVAWVDSIHPPPSPTE